MVMAHLKAAALGFLGLQSHDPPTIDGYTFQGLGFCENAQGSYYSYETIPGIASVEKCADACTEGYSSDVGYVGINFHPDWYGSPNCNCMKTNYQTSGKIVGSNGWNEEFCYSWDEAQGLPPGAEEPSPPQEPEVPSGPSPSPPEVSPCAAEEEEALTCVAQNGYSDTFEDCFGGCGEGTDDDLDCAGECALRETCIPKCVPLCATQAEATLKCYDAQDDEEGCACAAFKAGVSSIKSFAWNLAHVLKTKKNLRA